MKNRGEFQGASTQGILTPGARWMGIVLPLLGGLVLSGSALAAPCFAVDGTKVSVQQLFTKDTNPQVVDLEDMPSVSTMAARGPEAHNITFMGIKRDAARKNVTSFSARIDEKTYEFPKDACPKK